jgi:hypothetical protein
MPVIVTLDRLLEERSLSQAELSGRIGLTPANLNILKTGKAKAIRFSWPYRAGPSGKPTCGFPLWPPCRVRRSHR